MTVSATNPQTLKHKAQGRSRLNSQQLPAAEIVFVAILFVFLCSPSKKASQNLGGLHFLSAEQIQGTPSEESKATTLFWAEKTAQM